MVDGHWIRRIRRVRGLIATFVVLGMATACGASRGAGVEVQAGPTGRSQSPAATGWSTIKGPGLSARAEPILVAAGDRIITLGGTSELVVGDVRRGLTDGSSYDPKSGEWTPIHEAPFTPFGAVWIQDRLFVAGSDCAATPVEEDAMCPASPLRAATYDPRSNSWTQLPSPELSGDIGPDNYGYVYAIGSHAVLRLVRHDPAQNKYRPVMLYEAWSAVDGWSPIPNPPGNDDQACQTNDALASLSYAYTYGGKGFASPQEAVAAGQAGATATFTGVSVTTMDSTLRWSKLAGPDSALSFENEPTLACTGSKPLVWETSGDSAHAFTTDIPTGMIAPLAVPAGGFPNAPVTVQVADDVAVIWDRTDDNPAMLEFRRGDR